MSLYQQAAHLNNLGIASLLSEDYQRCIRMLGISIKILKRRISKPGATNHNDSQSSSSIDFDTIELPNFRQQQNFFIFNHAFQIPEVEVDEGICRHNVNTMVAAVLFNLALTEHRQYLNNDQSIDQQTAKTRLRIAEKMYCMALKLLRSQPCHSSRGGLIIKLASIINLSSIRFDSCYELADEARQTLSYFISSIEAADNNYNNNIFEKSTIQALLINLLLLESPKVAPAA